MANKVLLIVGIQLAFMNNHLYTQKRNADKTAHLGGYVYLLLCWEPLVCSGTPYYFLEISGYNVFSDVSLTKEQSNYSN